MTADHIGVDVIEESRKTGRHDEEVVEKTDPAEDERRDGTKSIGVEYVGHACDGKALLQEETRLSRKSPERGEYPSFKVWLPEGDQLLGGTEKGPSFP